MAFRTILIIAFLLSCDLAISQSLSSGHIETVTGRIPPDSMGITLIHEHILVDFIGADQTGYERWNRDSVIQVVLPYLMELKKMGVATLVECTPSYLGKDPILLKTLSDSSGIQILTNTGYYGAVDEKYLPEHAFSESSEELSRRWIEEFENGIEETGIKPGFIKISVNAAPLSQIDEKLVRAAAKTQLKTGLVIASHTGAWNIAAAEIKVLQEEGVDPSAFIWVHAQGEEEYERYKQAAEIGVWISLDGIAWDVPGHLEKLIFAKENNLLNHILISHDAGWYSPGEKNGGDFKGYTAIFDELIPLLKSNGFTQKELDLLLIDNPKKAFSILAK